MGRRGPRPTPTAILAARGSRRAERNRHEPVPPPGLPACPDWIDEDAKRVWADLVTILQSMGVLTTADAYPLTRYCQLLARWKRVEMFIQKYGETYTLTTAAGKVKCVLPFPQVGMAHKLSLALTKLEQEFGLTPSARARIEVSVKFLPPPELTEFEKEFPVNWNGARPPAAQGGSSREGR